MYMYMQHTQGLVVLVLSVPHTSQPDNGVLSTMYFTALLRTNIHFILVQQIVPDLDLQLQVVF